MGEFIYRVNEAIQSEEDAFIYVDATHLTERARNKILDHLHLSKNVSLVAINLVTSLETCLARNAKRNGLSNVPKSAIKIMYKSFKPATPNEKYKYDEIITIYENGGYLWEKFS